MGLMSTNQRADGDNGRTEAGGGPPKRGDVESVESTSQFLQDSEKCDRCDLTPDGRLQHTTGNLKCDDIKRRIEAADSGVGPICAWDGLPHVLHDEHRSRKDPSRHTLRRWAKRARWSEGYKVCGLTFRDMPFTEMRLTPLREEAMTWSGEHHSRWRGDSGRPFRARWRNECGTKTRNTLLAAERGRKMRRFAEWMLCA